MKKLSKERGEETQSDQLDDVGAAINELVKASSIRTKEHLRLCGTNHSDGGFDILSIQEILSLNEPGATLSGSLRARLRRS